jgi:transcriptional regulator with XRE-family HTH domain
VGLELPKTLGTKRHRALIDFLVARRDALNMSQAQLASRLGEYQSFVARLESGDRRVDVVEFMKLGEILGFDPAKVISNLKKTAP